MAEAAADYTKNVPDFTCRESIHSEGPAGFQGRRHASMDTTGYYRVRRSETNVGKLEEVRTFDLPANRPFINAAPIVLPYNLSAAFGPALDSYLSPARRACLRFSLTSADRIDFVATPLAGKGLCYDIAPQATGFAQFDPQTGSITHYERKVPQAVLEKTDFAAFASIDYAPSEFDGQIYQLPTHIVGSRPAGEFTNIFDAYYTNCHLNKAKSRILTDTITASPSAPIIRQAPAISKAGVLHYSGPPVHYGEVITFSGLPGAMLRFSFDQSSWAPRILHQPDGTQILTLRSLSQQDQTQCEVRWEIAQ